MPFRSGIAISMISTSGQSADTWRNRLAPGRGLANHPQIGMGLEQEPEAITHHGMVIGQEDLDRHRLPCHLFQEHRQVLPDLVVQIAGDLPPFQRLGRHQPAREFVQPLAPIAHLPATSDIAQRRNFLVADNYADRAIAREPRRAKPKPALLVGAVAGVLVAVFGLRWQLNAPTLESSPAGRAIPNACSFSPSPESPLTT